MLYVCIECHIKVNMYHVSAQGVDELMINVHDDDNDDYFTLLLLYIIIIIHYYYYFTLLLLLFTFYLRLSLCCVQR